MGTFKLFVYGSLKRGFKLSSYLRSANFIAEAKTVDEKYILVRCGGWYPGMIEAKDHSKGTGVRGELFEVPDSLISTLDRVEGHPFLFIRKEIKVECEGKIVEAIAYFYNQTEGISEKDYIGDFWEQPNIAKKTQE